MLHIFLSLFIISYIAILTVARSYFQQNQAQIQVRNNISDFFASIAHTLASKPATQAERIYVYSDERYRSRNINRRF